MGHLVCLPSQADPDVARERRRGQTRGRWMSEQAGGQPGSWPIFDLSYRLSLVCSLWPFACWSRENSWARGLPRSPHDSSHCCWLQALYTLPTLQQHGWVDLDTPIHLSLSCNSRGPSHQVLLY